MLGGRFGGWLGFGLEEFAIPVLFELFGSDGAVGAGFGDGLFGGPEESVEEEAALVGFGEVAVEVAAGEAEATTAVGAIVGPGDGFLASRVGFGVDCLAAGVGHEAGQDGCDTGVGEVEVVEPAIFGESEGGEALGGFVDGDGGEVDVPVAAAANVGLEDSAEPLFEARGEIGWAVDALMEDDEACASVGEGLDVGEALWGEEGEFVAAVHEEKNTFGIGENVFVLGPAVGNHDGGDARHLG